ncbi:hypothetical protein [Changpingibacter yushuensis]|uniref:hypothetical protein n=1 Tax=Changpingibacter yushuensis TaxID=2758440 RepID=UPI0015F5F2D2|nr:hypothetical protein [Changpingibacter yushuensis]
MNLSGISFGPTGAQTIDVVLTLIEPVVACIREHPENGRTYLHELVFGDPREPHHHDGLTLSLRLEDGITSILTLDPAQSTRHNHMWRESRILRTPTFRVG